MPAPTPHINAKPGDFAETVLMPGDPLRSQYIAATFFEAPVLVNNIRGVQGYTGIYHGKRVSVMASGMGMPSMAIYSYELYHFYGVKNIIRVGSAGALQPDLPLRSIVIGMSASYDSTYANQFGLPGTYAPAASYPLLRRAADRAEALGLNHRVGSILSSDVFYNQAHENESWRSMGILAAEMEAAALYMNAARAGKNALAICTISDHLITGEKCTAEERQTAFTGMMELALDIA